MPLPSKKIFFTTAFLGLMIFSPPLVSTKVGNSLVSKIISETTSSKCYLEAKFSYFQPQFFSQIKLIYDQCEIQLNDVSIDHISSMIFNKKNALINIQSFTIRQTESLHQVDIKTADLSPPIPLRPFGFYCDIVLKNGSFIDQTGKANITKIDGHIFYSSKNPIDINLNGACGNEGFIKVNGQFDTLSKSINTEVTIKNCSANILPDSLFKPLVTNNFDLYFLFDGSLDKGHALYQFQSPDLTLEGQFDINGDHILVKDTNKLFIKRSKPYLYKNLAINDLSGQIILTNLDLKLATLPEIKSVFCSYEGSTGAISYQDQKSGPFKILGHLSQENNDVLIDAILTQDKKQLLKMEACYAINQASLKKGFIQADDIPLIFPLTIDKFSIGNRFSLNANFFEKEGSLEGSFQASSPHIKALEGSFLYDKTSLSLNQLQGIYDDNTNKLLINGINVKAPLDNLGNISGKIQVELTQFDTLNPQLLPFKADLDFSSLSYIKSMITSPNLKIGGIGSFNLENQDFLFKDTWSGELNLDPCFSNIKLAKQGILGKIQIPSGSKFSAFPVAITLDPFLLNSSKEILVKDALFKMDVNTKNYDLNVTSKAIFHQKETVEGSLNAYIEISKGSIEKASLNIKNPPLEALSPLSPDIEKTAYLFGKNLALDFNLTQNGQTIDMGILSENLKVQGSFGFKDNLYLIKPIKGTLHIKTLDVPFIKTNLPFKLKKPFDIGLEIKAIDVPLLKPQIEDIALNGQFNLLNLSIEQGKKVLQMEAFNASFSKSKGNAALKMQIDADLFSSYDKVVTSGSLQGSFDFSGLSGSLSSIQTENASIKTLFKLDNFPTLALDFLQNKAQLPFSSTFGETLNAKFEINHTPKEGSFKILATGKETVLKLSAKGTNRIYALNDDVVFQTRLSPELSKLLFSSKPSGIEKLTSDFPLVCRINSSGSQFTLFPFRPELLSLSSCLFDFGRVNLDSSKILPQTLNLLKSSSRGDNLSVWFQPIKTSIKNGLMNVQRFDFLVQDAFQMALWGDLDFNQKQVGLTLGLTASCLQKAFGISELPKSYVIQIPVYGPFDDVKIDSKKATTKIAKLLALQHGGNLLEQFGGKSGGAIGGILKELSKIPDGDKRAPEPQTPFPWEKTSTKTTHKPSEKQETKKAIRSSDSPVKQLLKVFF